MYSTGLCFEISENQILPVYVYRPYCIIFKFIMKLLHIKVQKIKYEHCFINQYIILQPPAIGQVPLISYTRQGTQLS